MDRLRAIAQLSARLGAASDGADWDALQAACTALAADLPALAARGPWTAPERAALVALRSVHAQAFQLCSEEKQRLGLELGDIQANKEGWLAYALIGETELDGN
ncbi:hypothetical protein ACFDR9_003498 [Janthinobacterium sp. CG_23.3]|uniref:hypothetical protein n=1 Tax=unclassified Janthinobacterium TaxID=2610881 RepID=UPI000346CDA7|nr:MULTISPECIES: hypothetical protein [unclassified Janthinobacterium]MEC5160629.1 hypothetical protein [Janthinobacterium sp. CG_S6]